MRRHRKIIPAQELIARAKNRRPPMPHIGRNYFYIVTKMDGRIVSLGPYNDAREAEEVAIEKINTTYEIVTMPTRDKVMATRMLRHKLLQGSSNTNLEDSLRRMKHTI